MKVIVFLVFLVAIAAPCTQASEIFVCEKNGRKEFSQMPCGDNATVIQDATDPSAISIVSPMKGKDITRLCQLVIKAKDRAAVESSASSSRKSRRYYPSGDSSGSSNTPKVYVLRHITNLEQLASRSPSTYEMLKGLTDHVSYQGFGGSPIYNAERAAALTKCEDYVFGRLNRDQQ